MESSYLKLKFHTLANLFITCVLLWIFCSGAANDGNDVQEVVRAKRVEVVDDAGKVRISLGYENGNQSAFSLTMFTTKQKEAAVRLLAMDGNNFFVVSNGSGGSGIVLNATETWSEMMLYSQPPGELGGQPAAKEPGKAIHLLAKNYGVVITYDPVTGRELAALTRK